MRRDRSGLAGAQSVLAILWWQRLLAVSAEIANDAVGEWHEVSRIIRNQIAWRRISAIRREHRLSQRRCRAPALPTETGGEGADLITISRTRPCSSTASIDPQYPAHSLEVARRIAAERPNRFTGREVRLDQIARPPRSRTTPRPAILPPPAAGEPTSKSLDGRGRFALRVDTAITMVER